MCLLGSDGAIATLALSAAEVAIFLRGGTLRVGARLGNLSFTDDSPLTPVSPSFKQLLSIEGDDFADFSYETFDPNDQDSFPGYNSSVRLRAGSVKINFLEEPLHAVYLFLIKFARLKALYDSATQAAVQRASEIQRMKYDVVVQTPILVFPRNAAVSTDALTMKLGEIAAINAYVKDASTVNAGLRGISLVSRLHDYDEAEQLEIIHDVDIIADVVQAEHYDDSSTPNRPQTEVREIPSSRSPILRPSPGLQITVHMSDVKVSLTHNQYVVVMDLLQSIPRVLASEEDVEEDVVESAALPSTPIPEIVQESDEENEPEATVDLQPELGAVARADGQRPVTLFTKLGLVFDVSAIILQLYDGRATKEDELSDHGIARFALNTTAIRYKMLSNGAMEAEITLKSFVMANTCSGPSRFREMIPAAKHDGQQVMIHYTMTGGSDRSALALVTVDTPQIILAVDPIFRLIEFFTSPPKPNESVGPEKADGNGSIVLMSAEEKDDPVQPTAAGELSFRLNVVNASVSVLESDSDPNTQAIRLTMKELLISKQVG